jgi:thiol-disulfide isomerase/thioredoxin
MGIPADVGNRVACWLAATVMLVLTGGCGAKTDERMPPLEVAGWVDRNAPEASDLQGRVLVIDCWASWCEPCRPAVSDLLQIHPKYAEQGVQFLGLTPESAGEIERVLGFVYEMELPWPNAYGAKETIRRLGVNGYPKVVVVGRDGRIAWRGPSDLVELAIREALKK